MKSNPDNYIQCSIIIKQYNSFDKNKSVKIAERITTLRHSLQEFSNELSHFGFTFRIQFLLKVIMRLTMCGETQVAIVVWPFEISYPHLWTGKKTCVNQLSLRKIRPTAANL